MPHPDTAQAPAAADARSAVTALNRQYIEAVRRNDAAWFGEHMAGDALIVLGSGVRLGKADFLATLEAEPKRFRSLTVRDVTVRVFGPAVQVDADAPWELADGTAGVSRYVDTYLWLDGRWQVISAQVTWLPQRADA